MKIKTVFQLVLYVGCMALILFQGHRIQQLQNKNIKSETGRVKTCHRFDWALHELATRCSLTVPVLDNDDCY
jgi:hypothetical protein